jgi:hypothetical protein
MLSKNPKYSITVGTKIEVVKIQWKCYFEQNPQSYVALFDISLNKRKGKNASFFTSSNYICIYTVRDNKKHVCKYILYKNIIYNTCISYIILYKNNNNNFTSLNYICIYTVRDTKKHVCKYILYKNIIYNTRISYIILYKNNNNNFTSLNYICIYTVRDTKKHVCKYILYKNIIYNMCISYIILYKKIIIILRV